MVKNSGGNKAKGFARKNFAKGSSSLRLSTNELEIYAQVETILGGSNCHVKDLDGNKFLCHIRGKFRGRNKRSNSISKNSWVLVGLRDWEKEPSEGKLINCDLLEVYNDHDKDRLQNTVNSVNWSAFITKENSALSLTTDMENFTFTTKEMDDYETMIETQLEKEKTGEKIKIIDFDNEEDVNVDDI